MERLAARSARLFFFVILVQVCGSALVVGEGLAKFIDLRTGPQDFKLLGANSGDLTGQGVAFGDINGDGVDDMVVGAMGFDTLGRSNCGAVFVVLSSDTLGASINLASPRSDLKRIFGSASNTRLGWVMTCGDVNGDGRDDILCGLPEASPMGRTFAGEIVVIYGSAVIPDSIDLASPPVPVTRILGENPFDKFGSTLSVADVNNDSFGDIVAGAPLASTSAGDFSGRAYILYGAETIGAVVDLAGAPTGVTRILGERANDSFGTAVTGAEVTGDEFADVIVGAPQAGPLGRQAAGTVYLIPGGAALPPTIATAGVTAGITRLMGAKTGALTGKALSAGDVTGDMLADVIIGAPEFSSGGRNKAGAVYVVPGRSSWAESIDLNSPPTGVGRIDGPSANAAAGHSIAAGDLNRDAMKDIVIGAPKASRLGRTGAGEIYIVFGRELFSISIDLAVDQPGLTAFVGEYAGDEAGTSVAVGRFNGDDYEDLLMAAPKASALGKLSAGKIYGVLGHPQITPARLLSIHAAFDGRGVRLEWLLIEDAPEEAMLVTRRDGGGAIVRLPSSRIAHAGPGRYVLRDDEVRRGFRYTYRLEEAGEERRLLFEIEVEIPAASRAALYPPTPNPFAGRTSFTFELPEEGPMSVCVYDILGKLVATLAEGNGLAGPATVSWNGRDNGGRPLPSGVYFVRLTYRGGTVTQKALLIR